MVKSERRGNLAGTLIVAVPILILIALLQKQFTNSFLSSGIK